MADDTRDTGAHDAGTGDDLTRLRSADPAAGAPEPDLEVIRARARERASVVPLRRPTRTLGVLAAAVALLAGTAVAGVAVGRVTAPDGPVVVAPLPEDTLPVVGGASPPIPTIAGQGAGSNTAPEAMPGPGMAEDKAMAIYPGYGVTLVPGPDLGDVPATAAGYRLDARGIEPNALARQLAAASPSARTTAGSWDPWTGAARTCG